MKKFLVFLLVTSTISLNAQIKFSMSSQTLGNECTWQTKLIDIDNDNDLDILFANWHYQEKQASQIWLNNGSGSFTLSEQIFTASQFLNAADLNNDGYPEVVCSNKLYANDHGNFVVKDLNLANGFTVFFDFDNDGRIDIVQADFEKINLYKNEGNLEFSLTKSLSQTKAANITQADFNNDGFMDMYVGSIGSNANKNGHSDRLWMNNGNGDFSVTEQNFDNYQSMCVNTADINMDGMLDIIVGNSHPQPNGASQPNKIWLNNGDNTFAAATTDILNYKSSCPHPIDIDYDGDLDLIFFNGHGSSSGAPNRLLINNNGEFTDSNISLGNYPTMCGEIGDIDGDGDGDGDGDLDLIAGNCGFLSKGATNRIWFNYSR